MLIDFIILWDWNKLYILNFHKNDYNVFFQILLDFTKIIEFLKAHNI